VPFEAGTGTVAIVVAAGTPAGVESAAPAGAEVGVAVPTTRAADAVVLPVTVWKMTWGTVRAVESTEMVDDEGIAVPDAEQGTVSVVRMLMVVTGILAALVTGTPAAVVAGTPVPVLTGAEGATLEAQVTMAGLELACGAQMPWK